MSGHATTQEILQFWFGAFGEDGSVDAVHRQQWFTKSPDFDREVDARFGATIAAAESGELDDRKFDPHGNLALVLLLDQFTRNTRRDRPEMYAADGKALELVRHAIAENHPESLRSFELYFLWMPLMHSELLADQEECVHRFEALARSAEPGVVKAAEMGLDYAKKHRDIVARFGRFPHRNTILGRESTAEELAFLETPGSSF